ncbi:MAG: peptide ABC transporter permease [Zetaproteobacteria bacterium]|nr:peptide ABC transporter permease [Pseudobdellovibrionaceae bacterium]
MLTYVIRRLLYMIPTLVGVAFLTFILFTIFGEDPVRVALGNHASEQAIRDLSEMWGLNKPYWLQFYDFLIQILTFNYGESFSSGDRLSEIFARGALVSLSLTAPPFFVGIFLNITIAMLIAYYRGSIVDRLSTILFVISMSISYLVYIIVLQYVLAYQLNWFPIQGYKSGLASIEFLLLPWLIIVLVSMGPDIRIYRTVFLDQTKADYIRTARAKGVSEQRIMSVHLLKNAMIPILTNTIISIPFLIMGAFVMERYFSIPGIGDITITAINEGDFPIIKAMTMMSAVLFAFFNLLTDLLYAVVDPRIKLS